MSVDSSSSGISRNSSALVMPNDKTRPDPSRKTFRESSQSRNRQDLIGRELRRLFSDVVNEPLPDAFQELLNQIDADRDGRARGEPPDEDPAPLTAPPTANGRQKKGRS